MRSKIVFTNWLGLCAGVFLALVVGCSDEGDSPTEPDPNPSASIQELVPARTVVGDSVIVVGADFGDAPEGRTVMFTGAASAASILSWGDEEILVTVPANATAGPIRIVGGDDTVDGPNFDVAPEVVSFKSDLVPFFQAQGCQSCHFGSGGSSGLSVLSAAEVISGGTRGAGVVPRRSGQSLLVDALKGDGMPRMPQGGNAVPAAALQLVEDWIDQGARDN